MTRATLRPRLHALACATLLAAFAACSDSSSTTTGPSGPTLCDDVPPIDGAASATATTAGTRPLPSWYDDAKLGIMVHWGVWAVPGWAECVSSAMTRSPVAAAVAWWATIA